MTLAAGLWRTAHIAHAPELRLPPHSCIERLFHDLLHAILGYLSAAVNDKTESMGIAPDKVLTVVDVNRLGWERGRAGDRPGPWRGRENVIDDRNVSGDEPYCSLASGPTSHHAAWPTWTPFSDHHRDVMRAHTHERFARMEHRGGLVYGMLGESAAPG